MDTARKYHLDILEGVWRDLPSLSAISASLYSQNWATVLLSRQL